MKLSEIILLAKAGYSRKEIQALDKSKEESVVFTEPEAERKAEETPNESISDSEVIAGAEESVEAETDSVSSVLPNLLKRIEALEGQRYSEAIRNAEMPAEESPEDAIIKFLEGGL